MPPPAPCVLEHLQQRLERALFERDRALHHHEQVLGRRHAESSEVSPRHARDRPSQAAPGSSFHIRLDRRAPRPLACGTRAPHRPEPPGTPAPHADHRPRGPAAPPLLPACHPTLPSCCSVPTHRGGPVLHSIALFSPAQKNPVARVPYGAASSPTPDPWHARGDAAPRLYGARVSAVAPGRLYANRRGPARFIRLPRLSSSASRTSRSNAWLPSLPFLHLLYRVSSLGCPACSIRRLPRRALLVASGEGDPCRCPG